MRCRRSAARSGASAGGAGFERRSAGVLTAWCSIRNGCT